MVDKNLICDDNLERREKVFINDSSCRKSCQLQTGVTMHWNCHRGLALWGRSAHLAQSQQIPGPTVVADEVGGELIPICATASCFMVAGEGTKCHVSISVLMKSQEGTHPPTRQ